MEYIKYLFILLNLTFFIFSISNGISWGLTPEEKHIQIQSAIKAKNANWTADLIECSLFPEFEQNKLIGENFFEHSGGVGGDKISLETAPDSFDWRSKGVVTSIKDHGNKCDSGWAFAAIAAMEANIMIKNKSRLDLSEQYLISCDTGNNGCNGGYLDRVAGFLKGEGTVDEACFPYVANNSNCNKKCSDWKSRIKKISSWGWTFSNIESIKQALYNYGVLIAEFTVYSDFMYYQSGIYKHTSGSVDGRQAVAIVGYDTTNQYWICKNSKGSGWGENGYFRIKWNTVDLEKSVIWIKIN